MMQFMVVLGRTSTTFIFATDWFCEGLSLENVRLKVDSHILRCDAARHEAVQQDAA